MSWGSPYVGDVTERVSGYIPDIFDYVPDLKIFVVDYEVHYTSSRGNLRSGHSAFWPDLLEMTRESIIYNLGSNELSKKWIEEYGQKVQPKRGKK